MSTRQTPRATILIVDDEPSNIATLVALLGSAYELSVATSGPQALELLAGDKPELILLDVMMPGMDGYSVCAALKQDALTRDIPVIFVTAATSPASETLALAGGAVDFVHKPVNKEVLRARIRLHLELKGYRDHLEERVHLRTLELAQATDEARAADRAKRAFLGKVGHELRTPMNHVMGYTYLLGREIQGARAEQLLAGVKTAQEQLLRRIEVVTDFAAAQAGNLGVDVIDLNLRGLVDRVERDFADEMSAKGLRLLRELAPELPADLRGDPLRLRQVLSALMSNAVKFSGGQAGDITLRVLHSARHASAVSLRFEVQDQGIGLSADYQKRLYQAFEQADNSSTRAFDGLGLELALAQRTVALMGGELGFDTVEGQGSTFWFSLRMPVGQPVVALPAASDDEAQRIDGFVAYLGHLLADGDSRARDVWQGLSPVFAPVLGERMRDMQAALDAFDFATARRVLDQAVAQGRGHGERPGLPGG